MGNDIAPRHPLNYRRPSAFSAACPGRGRTLLGLLAALSASLPAVFAAVTVVVLVSLFPATVEAQGDLEEPCPGGGYNPTPVAVAVTAVPIVVASTTADYFVLYVRHTVGETTTVEVPVLVTLGKAGTTTLAENVEALPAEHYRVEKYLIADPADVDGDCVDDITELGDPVGMNPVNPAPAIALSDGAVAIPDRETFETLAFYQETVKFVLIDMDTDAPGVYFMNTENYQRHAAFLDTVGIEWDQDGLIFGWIIYDSKLVAPDGSQGAYYYQLLPRNTGSGFSLLLRSYTLLAASMPLLDDNLALHISNDELRSLRSSLSLYRESRIALVFDDDVLRGTDFLALNPGEGFGLLRALDPDERPTSRDVVIYETLPNNLPRVAGIISTVPQTPLSHVNLRAVQDGIPNAFIRNALEDTDIEPLIGSYVHYTVTQRLRPWLPGSPPGPPGRMGPARGHPRGSRCPLRRFPALPSPDAGIRSLGHGDQAPQRDRFRGLEGVRRQGGERGRAGYAGVSGGDRPRRVCDPVLFLRRVHEVQRLLHSH